MSSKSSSAFRSILTKESKESVSLMSNGKNNSVLARVEATVVRFTGAEGRRVNQGSGKRFLLLDNHRTTRNRRKKTREIP